MLFMRWIRILCIALDREVEDVNKNNLSGKEIMGVTYERQAYWLVKGELERRRKKRVEQQRV